MFGRYVVGGQVVVGGIAVGGLLTSGGVMGDVVTGGWVLCKSCSVIIKTLGIINDLQSQCRTEIEFNIDLKRDKCRGSAYRWSRRW